MYFIEDGLGAKNAINKLTYNYGKLRGKNKFSVRLN